MSVSERIAFGMFPGACIVVLVLVLTYTTSKCVAYREVLLQHKRYRLYLLACHTLAVGAAMVAVAHRAHEYGRRNAC
jgi:hypothetical protein